MSLVRKVVTEALAESRLSAYTHQTEPIIAKLEAAEAELVGKIRRTASGLGASDRQVEEFLVSVGLVEPTPEPTPEPVRQEATTNGEGDLAGRVARLEELAQRHLGSRF